MKYTTPDTCVPALKLRMKLLPGLVWNHWLENGSDIGTPAARLMAPDNAVAPSSPMILAFPLLWCVRLPRPACRYLHPLKPKGSPMSNKQKLAWKELDPGRFTLLFLIQRRLTRTNQLGLRSPRRTPAS